MKTVYYALDNLDLTIVTNDELANLALIILNRYSYEFTADQKKLLIDTLFTNEESNMLYDACRNQLDAIESDEDQAVLDSIFNKLS